jgi:hypothetical protein
MWWPNEAVEKVRFESFLLVKVLISDHGAAIFMLHSVIESLFSDHFFP